MFRMATRMMISSHPNSSRFEIFDRLEDFVVQDDHIKAKKGLESVDLGFSDIRMELHTGRSKKNGNGVKVLLDGSIRGRARPGRMLAIMGPSGAGKVRSRV